MPQDAFLGPFLAWERGNYPASVAFPSFHVIWAVLIAHAGAGSLRLQTARPFAVSLVWWGWAVAVCASCVTTGMHWISDIAAGLAVSWAAIRYESIWGWMKARISHPGWALGLVAVAMVLRRLWVLG